MEQHRGRIINTMKHHQMANLVSGFIESRNFVLVFAIELPTICNSTSKSVVVILVKLQNDPSYICRFASTQSLFLSSKDFLIKLSFCASISFQRNA
jgi:hypothetical protein